MWLATLASVVLAVNTAHATPQTWPIALSLHNEALGLPGLGGGVLFLGPVHLGVQLGTEFNFVKGHGVRLFQAAEGAYADGGLERAGGLKTQFGFAGRVVGPLWAEVRLGAGIWYAGPVRPTFDANTNPTGGYWSIEPAAKLNIAVVLPWGIRPEIIAGYEARVSFPLQTRRRWAGC
jgi:hypothetical protein